MEFSQLGVFCLSKHNPPGQNKSTLKKTGLPVGSPCGEGKLFIVECTALESSEGAATPHTEGVRIVPVSIVRGPVAESPLLPDGDIESPSSGAVSAVIQCCAVRLLQRGAVRGAVVVVVNLGKTSLHCSQKLLMSSSLGSSISKGDPNATRVWACV